MSMPFRPVYGPESLIQQQAVDAGYLYIATDTGKIFLDTEEERIVIGANGAAVLYANADGLKSNTDDSYTLQQTDLDDLYAIPKKDDLIINTDGRFFRVNYFYQDETSAFVNCKLIAVSGTGGGGTGGAGPDTSDPKTIEVIYEDLKYSFLYGQNYFINLVATSKVDTYLNVSYVVTNANGKTVDMGTVSTTSGKKVSLNVGRNIAPDGTYHGVEIKITGANSHPYSKTINRIRCINLKVENDTDNFVSEQIYDNTVTYHVKLYGQVQKTLNIEIDGQALIAPISSSESESGVSKSIDINCMKLGLSAGVHTITAYLVSDGVESNKVKTDFIYHPANALDTTYVIITSYPERCLSYENPLVKYWVYDTSKTDGIENTIQLIINGALVETVLEKQEKGKQGTLKWNVVGLAPDQENSCEISCNGVSRKVSIYCEYSNIFDQITDNAVILLSADGRTNSTSLERRLIWEYTNNRNETISAKLENFNWNNNGWMVDDNGRNCLRISNDAKVEIPLTLFTNERPDYGGFTFDFEFNPYNLYSYNLLTQSTTTTEDDSGEDDKVTIERTFDTSLAAITYIATEGENDFGFCCGTQDAFFRMDNGDNTSVRYTDNTIVNITVTINAANKQICMYVNGVMSGMVAYKNSARLPAMARKIIINSEQCDLDLYNIRVYNKALTSSEVVQNYIASKKDLEIYRMNSFSTGNSVNLNELISYNIDNPNNATIPYVIFKTKTDPDLLPYNKANADVICDIQFTNPALDYEFSLGNITEEQYKKHCPSFLATDVTLNVQGTSSQKYPRKNFKGKFKKVTSWECTNESIEDKTLTKFYMRPNIAEKTFTWKADYMDSSSAHNTGFVSYVYDLYWNHPLDYYYKTNVPIGGADVGEKHKDYRTSLFGFPVLAFHEKSDGTIEFIGRYNFNLDKSADDTLGMALEEKHPVLTDKTIAEVCECWEMANNMGGRCSFRGKPFDNGYDYNKKKFITFDASGKEIEGHSDLGEDLEVRYHINGDAIEGAWANYDKPQEDGGKYIGSEAAFNVLLGGNADGTGRTGAYTHLERLFKWLNSCFFAFDLSKNEDMTWVQTLLNRNDEIKETDNDYIQLVESRKSKFQSEFHLHFNEEYCMIYYIMTELLLQFDSRGKNMMLSSWGPIEEFQTDVNGEFILDENGEKVPGEYIWFPIYYDVDTQLGVNNSGIPSWEYNVEPTTGFNNVGGAKTFSTPDSLLWQNFYGYYEKETSQVQSRYRTLRGSNLIIPKLNGYYDFNYHISNDYCMKGILPINIMNANQYYKYIQPSIDGYVTGIKADGTPEMRKTSSYFYCLQGTRELHRQQFLQNRFNYYDSKWMAQAYEIGKVSDTAAFFRINTVDNSIDETLSERPVFNVKPKLDQYIVGWPDDSSSTIIPVFTKGGQSAKLDFTDILGSEYNQQIIRVGGADYIQEYGNLSLAYLDEFEYRGSNIVKIELGNENSKYENSRILQEHMNSSTANKPLLKVFDITNINSNNITSVDLSESVKLEEFKALGTKLANVDFAYGANLQKVYLPSTLNTINLKQIFSLNKIFYEENDILDQENKQNVPGLYFENLIKGTGNDISTNIGKITIIGGNLKQYSYELLEKITNAKLKMIDKNPNETLAITMEDVHWTPYTRLGDGAQYDANKTYVYATNNASFETYQYTTENKWNLDILSERIYVFEESPVALANSLELLNTYINDKKQHFVNVTDETEKQYPIITGSLYVNNDAANPISEAELFNTYAKYYPGLDIRAAHVADSFRARFVSYIDNVEKELYVQRVSKTAETTYVTPPNSTSIPAPSHHEFKGWSLIKPTGDEEQDLMNVIPEVELAKYYFSATETSYSKPEFVFYAIYATVSYPIVFKDTKTIAGEPTPYNWEITLPYGSDIVTPEWLPSRSYEESLLPIEERIAFKGWTNIEANSGIVKSENLESVLIDLSRFKADKNHIFYPIYVKENVFETPTESKYFYFEPLNDGTLIINFNSSYYAQGKITLPSVYDGQVISQIGNFIHALGATHIFFMKDAKYTVVSDGAFDGQYWGDICKLKAIYLPQTITTIGKRAFQKVYSLEHISDKVLDGNIGHMGDNITSIGEYAFAGDLNTHGQYVLTKLPENLIYLGKNAFYYCGANVTFQSLPKGLTEIPEQAFYNAKGIQITEFGSRVNEDIENPLITIRRDAFRGAAKGVSDIYIWSSVKTIEDNAFKNYSETFTENNNTYSNVNCYTPKPYAEGGAGSAWATTLERTKAIGFYKPVNDINEIEGV